ncbi:DUF881 domain-containing protein [Vallicoccus soli]|uniref:DUF881 domain-containing protein n=1 Tax=Vallicoccus soli TaxID=2339232 RepID=A0A3A3YS47_9ACTN|nr:DUF881 domain-containing protein [Vallicoccus soli]RJK93134.1 DUF881 domain-containing protein [Vallicoccus soli]
MATDEDGTAAPGGAPAPRPTGWAALRRAAGGRPSAGRVTAAVLLGLLGFAVAVQVRSTQAEGLESLREADLVRILDDAAERSARLRAEAAELEETRRQLASGTDGARAAVEEARRRAEVLAVLAGTAPATGPGVEVVVPDEEGAVDADQLLDLVQELRDAGAEAVQVGGGPGSAGGPVRVVAQTWFVDGPDGPGTVEVDGTVLAPPYRVLAVGAPETLSAALGIPGGVEESLRRRGSEPRVTERDEVLVDALRPPAEPQYASPAPAGG